MKTLIIPCAGGGLINGRPKYLSKHPDGTLLVRKCMQGIPEEIFNRIVITILKKDEEYGAEELIKEAYCDVENVDVVILPEETSGPAETIYQTIRIANISGEIVIKDSDNFLQVEQIKHGNFAAGLDLNEWNKDVHNLRNKSFLVLNEQKQILDVYEKQFKSDVISLGLYGFAEVSDFVFAYERLNDQSYPIKKLYVSHIISYLIGYSQKVFHYIPCLEYENWGNEKVWKDVQKDYGTYFVDLDSIVLDKNNIELLKELQLRGATFVGFTAQDINKKQDYINLFNDYCIQFIDIVCNCSYSNIKMILNTSKQLEEIVYEH